jgi:broad-specificity NMP kinase
MPEHSENAAADLMGNIMETIAENLPKQKSVRFDNGEGSSISDQAKKLFGGGENRKKSVHHVLGGGKCTYCIPRTHSN